MSQIQVFNHAELQNQCQKWKSRVSKGNEFSFYLFLTVNQCSAVLSTVVSGHNVNLNHAELQNQCQKWKLCALSMQSIFSLFIFYSIPVQSCNIFSCFPAQIKNFNHAKLQNQCQKWKSRVSKCNEFSNHWWLMTNERCAIIFIVVSWHKFKISIMPNFKIGLGNENCMYQNAMNFQSIYFWW